jgi:hypothetical protein
MIEHVPDYFARLVFFGGHGVGPRRVIFHDKLVIGLASLTAVQRCGRVKHRPRLVVVQREGPKYSRRNVRRQRHLVGFACFQVLLFCVQKAHEILRAYPRKPHNHR